MQLTTGQYAALKANIAANTAAVQLEGTVGTTPINQVGANPGNCQAIADWYNLAASPAYKAWDNAVSLKSIRSATDLSKYTPTDAVPASPSTDMTYQNRALICQLKQGNAFFLIQGEGTVDATPAQYRTSFNDCMAAIPSGVGGANANAGWGTQGAPGAVRLAMQRSVTNVEKLYTVAGSGGGAAGNVSGDTRGSTTNPDALVFVGPVSGSDVLAAMTS